MQIEQVKIGDIKMYERNAKKHPDKQVEQIVKSIKEFGFNDPIAIDENNVIIEGHGRYLACKKLNIEELPCIRLSHLSDKQKKAYILAHNKLTMNTGYNEELLNLELMDILELNDLDDLDSPINMDDFGFDMTEYDKQNAEEDDYEIPDEIQTDIKYGDIYQIGEHRLMCGDSTKKEDVEKLMDGENADMVFTDPPYNVAFNGRSGKFDVIKNDDLSEKDFEDLINGFVLTLKTLKPKNYYVWCNWKFYGILQGKLNFNACIVWAKNVFGLGRGYRHQHEFCLFGGKLDDGINNETDLWQVKKDTNYQHPTQKPIELASRALQNHKQDKMIVDLFLGSGSTMVACHQLNRKCYGLELDPKYCQVIIDRMLKLDPGIKIVKL